MHGLTPSRTPSRGLTPSRDPFPRSTPSRVSFGKAGSGKVREVEVGLYRAVSVCESCSLFKELQIAAGLVVKGYPDDFRIE